MTWTVSDIESTLAALRVRRGDSASVEVKLASGGLPENLDRTVCAFANMPDGGTIMFGIDEREDFRVVGVENAAVIEAGAVDQARSKVTPTPAIKAYSVDVNGKQVVVLEVVPLPLADRPAIVDGRAYLRQSDGDYPMAEHELQLIESSKALLHKPVYYDSTPVEGLTVDDLDADLVHGYLARVRAARIRLADRSDEEILRKTSVIVASGEPTLAGLYAMGDYPQGRFPSLTVTAAVQLQSGGRAKGLEHFTGPIPDLLEDVLAWVAVNMESVRAYRQDGHMEERPELPLLAVRELVANALVHRDLGPHTLGVGRQIQIRLTPRSLMVQSPGGLRGISLGQIESEEHAQAAVNQRLYAQCQSLITSSGAPVIEGEGGGIREVFRAAEEYGLRPPKLIDTGVQFTALLWRPESMTMPHGQIHRLDQNVHEFFSSPKIQELLSTPISQVPRYVQVAEPISQPETSASYLEVATQDAVQEAWLDEYLATHEHSRNEPPILRALLDGPLTMQELIAATGLKAPQIRWVIASPTSTGLIVMDGGQGQRGTTYQIVRPDETDGDSVRDSDS